MKKFRPLGTSVCVGEMDGLRHGQVLWGVEASDLSVGMAWDWREDFPGVVAMSDPMTIVTNVSFVDINDNLLGDSQRIVHLNTAIYQLPWQTDIYDRTGNPVFTIQHSKTTRTSANRESAILAA